MGYACSIDPITIVGRSSMILRDACMPRIRQDVLASTISHFSFFFDDLMEVSADLRNRCNCLFSVMLLCEKYLSPESVCFRCARENMSIPTAVSSIQNCQLFAVALSRIALLSIFFSEAIALTICGSASAILQRWASVVLARCTQLRLSGKCPLWRDLRTISWLEEQFQSLRTVLL